MFLDLTSEQVALRDELRAYFATLISAAERETMLTERHGHMSNHVVYVLEGEITVGDVVCGPGTNLYLEKGAAFGPIEAGPDGAFTKLVGSNAAGPNFDGRVDGWNLSSAGHGRSPWRRPRPAAGPCPR